MTTWHLIVVPGVRGHAHATQALLLLNENVPFSPPAFLRLHRLDRRGRLLLVWVGCEEL